MTRYKLTRGQQYIGTYDDFDTAAENARLRTEGQRAFNWTKTGCARWASNFQPGAHAYHITATTE